jgi:hypothetical protein
LERFCLESVISIIGTSFTSTASKEKEKDKHLNQPNFLMHHFRDKAEKQWAETSEVTIAGVTRVFNSKCNILVILDNDEFHKMWLFLLDIIESLALSRNSEIALAALKGFHELLGSIFFKHIFQLRNHFLVLLIQLLHQLPQ